MDYRKRQLLSDAEWRRAILGWEEVPASQLKEGDEFVFFTSYFPQLAHSHEEDIEHSRVIARVVEDESRFYTLHFVGGGTSFRVKKGCHYATITRRA